MLILFDATCRFNPANDGTVYTSSSDGTISYTDLETGISHPLMDLNPDGWNVMLFMIHLKFAVIIILLFIDCG